MKCPIRNCGRVVGPAGALCFDHFGALTLRMQINLELAYLDEGPGRSALSHLKDDAVMFLEGRGRDNCDALPTGFSCGGDHV